MSLHFRMGDIRMHAFLVWSSQESTGAGATRNPVQQSMYMWNIPFWTRNNSAAFSVSGHYIDAKDNNWKSPRVQSLWCKYNSRPWFLDNVSLFMWHSAWDHDTYKWNHRAGSRQNGIRLLTRVIGLSRMPSALMNALATFKREMETPLTEVKWQFVLVHLDDIVILSHRSNEHIEYLTCWTGTDITEQRGCDV